MHLCIHIIFPWIAILICFPLVLSGFFFQNFPTMKPNENTEIVLNQTIMISCEIKNNKKISLRLNNTEVTTGTSYIAYNFTTDRLGITTFKCNTNRIEITTRYAPRVIGQRAVLTAKDHCYLVVDFILEHYRHSDYMKIRYKENTMQKFKTCGVNSRVCAFKCYLFVQYIFEVTISVKEPPAIISEWTVLADLSIYKCEKPNLEIAVKSSEILDLSYFNLTGVNTDDKMILQTKTTKLIFKISYQSEWDENTKYLLTNETKIQLRDLTPYTTYTISVEMKVIQSIYWSNKTTVEERTLPSAPYKGPDSTNGSYVETSCAEKRCFILYWAMIPMSSRNGILEGFVIKQVNRTSINTSEIFVQIKDQPQNEDLWFEIFAKNDGSQYSPPTIIHIPPKAPKAPRGVSLVKLNSTHVNISWVLKQSLEDVNITMMSCVGVKVGSTFQCESNMTWINIQNENSTILEVVTLKNFATAVYISNSEGNSPLTFAECILDKGISKTPKEPHIIRRHPRQLNLQWPPFSCENLNGRPILFRVLYAEGTSCENGLDLNIPAIGTRLETENFELKDLKPFTNYSVCLKIQTEQGWSQSSKRLSVSTSETNPSSSVRNLTVTEITQTNVTLEWEPTLQPNGFITHHIIYYGEHETYTTNTSRVAVVSSLKPSTKYNFTVSACNKEGCSEYSAYVTATTKTKGLEPYIILLVTIAAVVGFVLMIGVSMWLYKQYQKYKKEWKVESPDVEKVLNRRPVPPSSPDKIQPTFGETIANFQNDTSKDDNDIRHGHIPNGYVSIDEDSRTDSQTLLIDSPYSCITERQEDNTNSGHDNVNNNNSVEPLETVISNGNKHEIHPSQIEMNSDGYIMQDSTNSSGLNQEKTDSHINAQKMISQLNQENSDIDQPKDNCIPMLELSKAQLNSNHVSPELSQVHQDQIETIPIDIGSINVKKICSKTNDTHDDKLPVQLDVANVDLNGYVLDKTNTSGLSLANSESGGYVQNGINSPQLSQVNSNSSSYVQDGTDSSGLSQADSGYVQNKIDSSESSQADPDSVGYVKNRINSPELSLDSDSNGYAQNEMNSPKLSQANSDSSGYVQNGITLSESSSADQDSNGYVKNKMNSSESRQVQNGIDLSKLNQAKLDPNGYVQRVNSSTPSPADLDSNGYVQNEMNSSGFSQANSESDGYVQNGITLSESSQVDADSNHSNVQNKMNVSKLSQTNLDSSGYVQNGMTTSDSSQADPDSNGYVQNKINSSESIHVDSDSNGYVQNGMNETESDPKIFIQNKIKPSESSQSNSSPTNRDSHITPSPLVLIPTKQDSNGYVCHMNPHELKHINSNSQGDSNNASKLNQAIPDSNNIVNI